MDQWAILDSIGAIASFNYLNCWIWWSEFFFLLIILSVILTNLIISFKKNLIKKN
jgi:hypothetical protein